MAHAASAVTGWELPHKDGTCSVITAFGRTSAQRNGTCASDFVEIISGFQL